MSHQFGAVDDQMAEQIEFRSFAAGDQVQNRVCLRNFHIQIAPLSIKILAGFIVVFIDQNYQRRLITIVFER